MKYFTIDELCKSATATRLGIANVPTVAVSNNLRFLVSIVLDPLRELYGKPIYVASGYRSPELNKSVNGAKNSQHLTGMAADIYVKGESNAVLATIIRARLPFDQLIYEKGTVRNPQWVHVSISRTNNRKQVLYYDGKRYVNLI